jgi:threonine dehydratase
VLVVPVGGGGLIAGCATVCSRRADSAASFTALV